MSPNLKRQRRGPGSARGPRSGTIRLGLVLAILVGINLYVFLWRGGTSIPDVMEKAAVAGDPEAARELQAEADRPASPTPGAAGQQEAAATGRDVQGEVQKGDSLGQILRREGLAAPEADRLIRALSPHLDFRTIRAGQSYRLHFDADSVIQEFEFHVSPEKGVKAVRQADGSFNAAVMAAATTTRTEEIGGSIEGSLYMSMKRSGEDTSLVAFFVDVFAYDLNFYIDTHAGDSYRMIVEKVYLDDQFLRYGRVLAAEYSGQAGTYRAFWWLEPGTDRGKYFDAEGRSVERTLLKTPLKYARVSSKFNPKRMHPVLHVRRGHWGVDYAAPTGTPIWAAASGRITFRGRRGGAGNCVIVRHDNGLQTTYMHMSKFKKGQKVGTRVRAKDVIGYVGATGLATGPHLHFGVKKNGKYIDPLKMKMTRGRPIAKKHRAQFEADTAKLVAQLADVPLTPPRPNPFVTRLAGPAAGQSATN